jgi:hypothetical protein
MTSPTHFALDRVELIALIQALEEEKNGLQQIVCGLMRKNEVLRRRVEAGPDAPPRELVRRG